MKAKLFSQILFSVCILALGAFALYEYNQSQKEKEQKIKEAFFLNQDLKLQDLKAVRIYRQNEQLEVVKEDQAWLLKQPIKDLSDLVEVSRWFDEIKNQKVQKIKIEKDIKWKDYHLDKSPRVEIEFDNGEIIAFSVSKKSSFDGKYFLRKGEHLFLGERYFSSEVNDLDFNSLRSKKLMPSLKGHVIKLKFQGKEKLILHWADYKWSLDEKAHKKTFPLDSNRLDGFWTDISGMRASDIKEAVTSSSLKKYGLNKPQLQITFSYPSEKGKEYILKLSPLKEDKAFVAVSHRNFILEISKDNAEKLILSKNNIRNHAFPFNYNKDSASQIKITHKEKSLVVKKEQDKWRIVDSKETAIDSKKVEDFLDKIQNLKAEKYKTGSIKKSDKIIEIKNAEGENIFELKESFSSGSYSWVKTNLWDEIVAISKSEWDEIVNADFTPDPKEEEGNDEKSSLKQ